MDLVISDQRRRFHDDYRNGHLLNMNSFIEISVQNKISDKDFIDLENLKKEICILIVTKE